MRAAGRQEIQAQRRTRRMEMVSHRRCEKEAFSEISGKFCEKAGRTEKRHSEGIKHRICEKYQKRMENQKQEMGHMKIFLHPHSTQAVFW